MKWKCEEANNYEEVCRILNKIGKRAEFAKVVYFGKTNIVVFYPYK